LHVFAHTSKGKPLAVLFDAKDDSVIKTRFLDDNIDPRRWHYKHRINDRCIEDVDRWRDYFIDLLPGKEPLNHPVDDRLPSNTHKNSMDNMAMALSASPNPSLETLARRYHYQIIYSRRSANNSRQPGHFIVVRFTDRVTSRWWDFELTGVRWHALRKYTDKPVSDTAIADNAENDIMDVESNAIKRLQSLLPVSWLTRTDNGAESDIIGKKIDNTGSHKNDPCWSEAQQRSITGKRAVTLRSFYYHYLRGLQLPSKNEAHSILTQNALSRMYFDCHYDKETPSGLMNNTPDSPSSLSISDASAASPPSPLAKLARQLRRHSPPGKTNSDSITAKKKHLDAILYPVVPSLRICAGNQRFDELRQICQ